MFTRATNSVNDSFSCIMSFSSFAGVSRNWDMVDLMAPKALSIFLLLPTMLDITWRVRCLSC